MGVRKDLGGKTREFVIACDFEGPSGGRELIEMAAGVAGATTLRCDGVVVDSAVVRGIQT